MTKKPPWWQRILEWALQYVSRDRHKMPTKNNTYQGPEYYNGSNNHNSRDQQLKN